jgi:DNA-binding HxlR family transcriptional regulator
MGEPAPHRLAELSVAELLKLLGTGAAGPILMALGRSSLRTRSLRNRLPEFAERTVYRHAGNLAEHGLVVRRDEGGVPSVVSYKPSERMGRGLVRLIETYRGGADSPEVSGLSDGLFWTKVALVGEMWESGWFVRLSERPWAPTELSEATPGLSFHQVNRRLQLLRSKGLLQECAPVGRGKRYELAPEARRAMGLVAGIGRWRERNGLREKKHGLTVTEVDTILRGILPMVELPQHRGQQIKLGIVGPTSDGDGGSCVRLAQVVADGSLRLSDDSEAPTTAWAAATIDTWLAALVDGSRGRMRVGGDLSLVDACLEGLYQACWKPAGPGIEEFPGS